MLFRSVLVSALLALGACASAPKPEPVDVDVTVSPAADGTWTADYRFGKAAPAWAFARSAVTEADKTPWRAQAWTVETPGVSLKRIGRYDVLSADGAALTSVRIRFKPFTEQLEKDYRPTLQFSDGGQAHYTNQFEIVPLTSAAAAESLPVDVDSETVPTTSRLTFDAPGRRILYGGSVLDGRVVTGTGSGGYAYFGDAEVIETPALAAVIDPGIPEWLRGELDAYTPKLLALHAEKLGPPAVGRPMVFAAWGGADQPGVSLNGGVLGGLMQMDLRGQRVLNPDKPVKNLARWFLGHETAHFWLAQTVRAETGADNWMMEGGADILAVRALGVLAPDYDPTRRLQGEVDDCLGLVGPNEPLAGALERGEPQAQYGCGAVLLLAAEAGLRKREPGADAYTFWRRLIDANREDGVVTADDWLAAFAEATGDAELTAETRRFVTEGVADPAAFVAKLFARTGVAHSVGADGKLKLGAN
ncbi:hypothetical protein [Caulobacter sp. 17J65-9]|uniref:hypothetical protein n=1 Tax=Caulobacter sp. 17J65-9 TaxID=2709382 RepID=UPI0013C9034E|nr:hypothetical protein [Caulobacter sp. 17J65-9]NEX94680.1 hypothetical protein [Caulobacter sp. 17J65-9]